MDYLNKTLYIKESSALPGLTIFQEPWWLQAMAGDDWDVVVLRNESGIYGALPFVINRSFGGPRLGQPGLTPHIGPWIKPLENESGPGRMAAEHKILGELIDALPNFSRCSFACSPSITNWLPFCWRGFQQTTYYTYRTAFLTNLDETWKWIDKKVKAEIKKAEQRYHVKIVDDLNIDKFIQLNEAVYIRQNESPRYQKDLLRNLDRACSEHNRRRIFAGVDADGNLHAAAYIVWDKNCAYYLMSGSDPDYRKSGALSLCLWEAIKFASGIVPEFDFEGSMIPSIERHFRRFGTQQTPYFRVWKYNSIFSKLIGFVRQEVMTAKRASALKETNQLPKS